MYITFTLKNQIIKRTDKNIVVANSKNYLRAKFTFLTDDWGGTVTGIFNGFTAILDKNNECVVPWEALQFPGELTVSAFCGDRQTANKVYLPIMESGYIVRQTPEPPTPDVYQQLIDIAKNAESVANSVREDADAGKFDGKPGAPGKDAPQINDTQSSPDNPWSGAKVDKEIKAVYATLEKSNIQFPVAYSGSSIHANNTLAENLTLNRNSVEILGQTIQNCLDHSSVDKFGLLNGIVSDGWIEISADGNFKNFRTLTDSVVAKPNTKYTFVVEVAEQSLQTGSGSYICFGETGAEANQPSLFVDQKIFMASNPLKVGINKFVLTTKNNFAGVFCADRGFISNSVISGSIKFRYMILEGDWNDKDVSWVPFGLNAPQTTEVKMVGRNLAKSFYAKVPTDAWEPAIRVDANFEPSTKYLLYVEGTGDGAFYPNEYLFKEYIDFGVGKTIVLTTLDTFSKNDPRVFDAQNGRYILAKNRYANTGATITKVLVERYDGDMDAAYVDYVENTITINKPLGSVSDTIRDRVYLKDGKAYYEQNVGSVIINGGGSQAIASVDVLGDGRYVKIGMYDILPNIISGLSGSHNLVICDRLAGGVLSGEGKQEQVSIYWHSTRVEVRIFVLSSRLTSLDKAGAQAFLQEDPLLVFYPIDPVTTEISISDFYSYEEQTNWYTTNAVKPTLKAEIPSNIGAVVGALAIENAQLKKSNLSMYQEMDGRMAAMEGTIPIMAEAANNLAEADASYREGVNSI